MARKFTGADDVLARLRKIKAFAPNEFARAQMQETEIEATACKREAPVLTGALRGSIEAKGPVREGRKVTTSIEAGGPTAPYARIVHEDLEAIHENGSAKYIERPLAESASHMAERIANRIDLNKAL